MRQRPARPGAARRPVHVGRPLARRTVGAEVRWPERSGPLGRRGRRAGGGAAQGEEGEVPGWSAGGPRRGGGMGQIAHAGTPEQVGAAERLLEQTRRELYRILAEADEPGQDEQDTEI